MLDTTQSATPNLVRVVVCRYHINVDTINVKVIVTSIDTTINVAINQRQRQRNVT